MLQYKKMHSNIIIYLFKTFHFIFSCNFLLCNFKTSFNLLNKLIIIIFNITFLKYNGSYLMFGCKLLIVSFLSICIFASLLRSISSFCSCILTILSITLIILFILCHIKYSDSIILIDIFSSSFCIGKMFMRLSYIFFRGQRKISSFHYIPKNTII